MVDPYNIISLDLWLQDKRRINSDCIFTVEIPWIFNPTPHHSFRWNGPGIQSITRVHQTARLFHGRPQHQPWPSPSSSVFMFIYSQWVLGIKSIKSLIRLFFFNLLMIFSQIWIRRSQIAAVSSNMRSRRFRADAERAVVEFRIVHFEKCRMGPMHSKRVFFLGIFRSVRNVARRRNGLDPYEEQRVVFAFCEKQQFGHAHAQKTGRIPIHHTLRYRIIFI